MIDYGSDFVGDNDLTATFDEMQGSDPRVVVQAVYRRLITARGTLCDDADYGLDVRGYIQRGMTPEQIAAIPGEVKSEIEKDDRAVNVKVDVLTSTRTTIVLAVSGDLASGPEFRLVLSATPAEVLLKEMSI